jgi:N-acetylglucosaminyl-diphospho-decaprenol L-rhamnosyltransferase
MTPGHFSASVTVSIVSHRQWALAQPLLQQLARWCAHSISEILVTVNVPEEVINAESSSISIPVRCIHNQQPKGFGANHNAAFRLCRTPWFLVLNPDIRIDCDVLTPMLAAAVPTAALIAPRIREPGRQLAEPFRDLLTPLELWRKRQPNHKAPLEPAWVAGMFMLVRRDAYEHIGGFDERFFMYCEDFDLCARLRLSQWQLQITPQVEVLHEAQRASNSSLRPLLWHISSLARVWLSATFWRYRRLLLS